MWRARIFLPRQLNFPSLKNHLTELKNGYMNTASILNRVKLASKSDEVDLKVGEEIEGFTVQEVSNIPEFQMKAIRLHHDDTGAQYLHLEREDTNNTFSINLRTTPFDSTGVPHILEHTTMCGSKKYPCRDPFFKMLNRSMATFMNAMTGPDYTFYPFATQNEKDYYNLMSVYMDAVFNPQLNEFDFSQEGWRLEHSNVDDPTSQIIFKGVVFNEMKGALSDNQRLFGESLMNKLLPSHTYSVLSGGDPLRIPELTYEQLKEFHARYYHPSNARFYSYGSFSLKNHLKFINDTYLKDYGKVEEKHSEFTKVPSENRWECEKKEHILGKLDNLAPNPEKQSSLSISYLCSDIKDIEETFVLQVLSELLTSGPNSSFYKSLIEPNVGSGFSPVTGFEAQTRDTFFSVGLQGLQSKDFDWVIDTYNKTIDKVIQEGFDENRIEAILHNIEINTKHQPSDFGLRFLYSLSCLWNHDGDIIKALRVNDMVEKFKDNLSKNPRYLQDKVEQYLKQNRHKLVLTMTPDKHYDEKKIKEEEELLKSKLANLTPDTKHKIYEDGIKLKEAQDMTSNVDCLPTLETNDLNKSIESDNLKYIKLCRVPVQISVQPTNSLTYVKGILDTSHLAKDLKPFLPLFTSVATKMGTKYHDYRELDKLAELKTGGLSLSLHIAEQKDDMDSFEDGIMFSSYSLEHNVASMLSLWGEIFNDIVFTDKARLETLMKATAAHLVNNIADNGHLYAMSAAAAMVNPAALRSEENSGLKYVKWLCNLVQENKYEEVLSKLNDVAKSVMSKKFMRLAVNLSANSQNRVEPNLELFINSLKDTFVKSPLVECDTKISTNKLSLGLQFETPLPVSYTSQSIPTVSYIHEDFAPLRILCRLLSSKFLLPVIREKGGAYGAGARLSYGGVMSFFSYRDPNPTETFKTFDAALNWVNKKDFTPKDVEEAKLGTFQTIDAPIPPGARGSRNFLYGIDEEEFNNHRLSLMNVNTEDVLRVASKYLDPALMVSQGRVLLGPKNFHVSKRLGELWTVHQL